MSRRRCARSLSPTSTPGRGPPAPCVTACDCRAGWLTEPGVPPVVFQPAAGIELEPYFLLEPGDGLLLCGAERRIVHVDRIAQQRIGHQAQQWLGMELDQAWPQLAELIVQEYRRLAEGPREHVVALPHPTGIELATRIRLFPTDSGFGVGVLRRRSQVLQPDDEGVSEEMTYRRLLEAVLDTAQDGVLVTLAEPLDRPGPIIVFANRALLEQTGYGLHEVLGRSPRMFQGPETSREATHALREALEQWQPAQMQVLNYRRDRSSCWIELKVAPLADRHGWHSHWVSVQRDITGRIEQEREWARAAEALAEQIKVKQATA